MKRALLFAVVLVAVLVSLGLRQAVPRPAKGNSPVFLADNELVKPENYREWIWLSSGLGMTYNAEAQSNGTPDPKFDNVFVTPEAYHAFLQTGTWPDKTIFVLEARSSISKGSINQQGRFQGQMAGVEAEVKDEKRFPNRWGFYVFGSAASAKPFPSDTCHACHSQNGAVDSTFVQFYPTLIDVAKRKGTFRSSPEASTPHP